MSPHDIDALYRSFPSFEAWSKCRVDTAQWDRHTEILRIRGEASPEHLAAARAVVQRAAAVDTGALEGLYEVDRGFTFTVATQTAVWEAALDARGPRTRSLIESQLRAYEYVLDTATGAEPITEAWIRTLHQELCRAQETYVVMTEVGPQTHALPVGEYKRLPNHVQKADGTTHAYAPVDLVPTEMHRLIEIFRSPDFLAAHPVLQSSYAHYAFILIHPFADGNGRVARALASVFTYRAASIPLMILADKRVEYLTALEKADISNFQAFIDFVTGRCFEAVALVEESLRAAVGPSLDGAVSMLDDLYRTAGGYGEDEVDQAGHELLSLFIEELQQLARSISSPRISVNISHGESGEQDTGVPNVRFPRTGNRTIRNLYLSTAASAPADIHYLQTFWVVVPLDGSGDDDVSLIETQTKERVFSARLSELLPNTSAALVLRMRIAAERLIARQVELVVAGARQKLKGHHEPGPHQI